MGNLWLYLFVVLAAAVAYVYNGLVSLRNRANNAWSDIEVQLKRRHDLVGNLVETVKGYSAHEEETLRRLVEARDGARRATDHQSPGEAGPAEELLVNRLRSVFAVVEAYPDLKASDGYLELHHALVSLEDHIQNARRYHNAVVRDLNTKIQSFPQLLVARPFGFREREFFRLSSADEADVPEVKLQ